MNKKPYIILFKTALVIIFSIVLSFVFGLSEIAWSPMAALLMIPTQTGAIVREGVVSYLLIVLSFLCGSFLSGWVYSGWVVLIYFLIGLGVSFFVSKKHALYILLILGLAILAPFSLSLVTSRLFGITLGAGIGIIINLVVFQPNIEEEFRASIVPLLQTYSAYFAEIVNLFLLKENSIDAAKKQVEEKWLQMPNWVYQSGFSIAFQAGHRHFVIRVEQAAEILFAANYLAREPMEKELLDKLELSLLQCVARVQQMFAAFIEVLYLHKLSEGLEDFSQDIDKLEKEMDGNKHLVAFVSQLKDLRFVMMKMAEALR